MELTLSDLNRISTALEHKVDELWEKRKTATTVGIRDYYDDEKKEIMLLLGRIDKEKRKGFGL